MLRRRSATSTSAIPHGHCPRTEPTPRKQGTLSVRPWNIALPNTVSLAALLATQPAWDWPYHDPAFWNAGTWIVTDQRSTHASIAPPPNPVAHRDVANAIGASPADIHVHYAAPSIWDHADRGHTSASVVIAADRYVEFLELPDEAVPYLLDLRPILLPLSLARATAGIVEVATLCERFSPHCPQGFCIRIIGGVYDELFANHYRQIEPGTVIRVEFHPTDPAAGPQQTTAPPRLSEEDAAPHPGPETDNASASHLSTSTSSGPQADTGGTSRTTASTFRQSMSGQLIAAGFLTKGDKRRLDLSKTLRRGRADAAFGTTTSVPPHACLWWLILASILCLSLHFWGEALPTTVSVLCCGRVAFTHPPPRFVYVCLLLYLNLVRVQAVQITPLCPATWPEQVVRGSPRQHCVPGPTSHATRPIPTPCRGARHNCHGPSSATNTGIDDAPVFYPELLSLHTLLDECSIATQHHFFLAATLLDTLEDHFACCAASTSPTIQVSLEQTIALTPFQQQVLDLRQILSPARASAQDSTDRVDWLDNDRSHLLDDPKVPLEQRTAFVNIVTWHEAGCPKPDRLRVFTDGSASNNTDQLMPCGWAFGVWVPYGPTTLLMGYASGTAVPPDSPYFTGEANDTPQTAEQLAIAWALVWAIEHAHSYACPVEIVYDCMVAGKGTFGDWRMPTQPNTAGVPTLAHNLVCLRHLAQATLNVKHSHVPGHAGRLEKSTQISSQKRRDAARNLTIVVCFQIGRLST